MASTVIITVVLKVDSDDIEEINSIMGEMDYSFEDDDGLIVHQQIRDWKIKAPKGS